MDKANSLHETLELDVFEANKQGRMFYAKYGFKPVYTFRDDLTGQLQMRLRYEGKEMNGRA